MIIFSMYGPHGSGCRLSREPGTVVLFHIGVLSLALNRSSILAVATGIEGSQANPVGLQNCRAGGGRFAKCAGFMRPDCLITGMVHRWHRRAYTHVLYLYHSLWPSLLMVMSVLIVASPFQPYGFARHRVRPWV